MLGPPTFTSSEGVAQQEETETATKGVEQEGVVSVELSVPEPESDSVEHGSDEQLIVTELN